MTELCPRTCCWLSTAGIFVLLGAIELTAGLVLLKSKYVFLLAGPAFWTAAGNIVTGALLGIAASVWNKPRRRLSSRYVARENLILALLFSSVLLNATTSAILIMGEGNAMLTIDVETHLTEAYNLGKEILRVAYATSVVCPVVCLVIAAMAVTEGCCNVKRSRSSILKIPINHRRTRSLLKVTPKRYSWVFDEEHDRTGDSSKKKFDSVASSSPTSSCCDDVMGISSIEVSTPLSKYPVQSTPTVEELQSSLSRMSHSRISPSHPPEESGDRSMSPPSLVGEMVAIQIRRDMNDAIKAIPVDHPLTSASGSQEARGSSVVDAAPTRVRIKIPEDASSRPKRNKFSSFKSTDHHYSPSKKNQKPIRSPAMESIIEVPSSEDAKDLLPSPSLTSGYGSSPEGNSSATKETASHQAITLNQIVVPVEITTPRKPDRETIPKELYAKTGLFRQEQVSIRAQQSV